jgi:7-cyano-7-deazaguanine reductase
MTELPLGKTTTDPDRYAPDLLFAIPRSDNRANLGIDQEPPFDGVDIWTAWELTWLSPAGMPQVATASIRIPADSPNIVESKSLKLYLGSFAMSRHDDAGEVCQRLQADIGACVGSDIPVSIEPLRVHDGDTTARLPGVSLDDPAVACDRFEVDAGLLTCDPESTVDEELHSDLLRSLCPVTNQPDTGSVLIRYAGPAIDHAGLLRYVVSYRRHSDFHENCVERMFVDILEQCRPERLSVYARYQRRGGIDINPFRSNFESDPPDLRLWRQ